LDGLGTENVAAVVLEPVSGTTGGALPPPDGYLERIAEICRESGVIFVLDETVTAFWRTGYAFAGEPNVQADIVFGGKCLAAGFAPLSCVVVQPQICDELIQANRDLPLRLTFAGNFVACVFGLVVQEYILEKGLGACIRNNSANLKRQLEVSCRAAGFDPAITGLGYLWAINVSVSSSVAQTLIRSIRKTAAHRGIEALIGQRPGKLTTMVHLMVCPPFDANDDDLKLIAEASADLMAQSIHGLRP